MKVLKDIAVESFAHPDDTKLMKGLEAAKINQLLEWLSGASTKYTMEMTLMGRYIRLSEKDMPQLYRLLEDVCRVLDYPQIPRVFMHRSKLFDWEVYIGKEPVIILTDFVLNDFDEGMLRFHLGTAVTALKAKTCQLRVASTFAMGGLLVGIPVLGAALMPVLTGWARAATLTEDRGGLLACQDERAAWRYMFRLSGIPRELIDEDIIQDYIAEYKPLNSVAHVSKNIQTITQLKPWQNERLVALYDWYSSGAYDDILEDY
ncbi:MAG: hypothetical protein IJ313_05190 [Clostridia bacterium]|nr:hypothetical protein [Clostridia bacterium]